MTMVAFFRGLAAVSGAAALSLTACASAGPAPAAETPVAQAAAEDYVLGTGDKVRVIVFGEPNLTGEFVVAGSGALSFPLVGDVPASGLTVPAFQKALQAKLADGYLRDPRVSVEVLTYRPFYILGEVNKPGEYPYTNGLTVMNAVATAGGFTYRANQKSVMIRGQGEQGERSTPVTPTTPVRPGDTIRVKERFF